MYVSENYRLEILFVHMRKPFEMISSFALASDPEIHTVL